MLDFQKFCVTYVTFRKLLKKETNKLCTFTSVLLKIRRASDFAAFSLWAVFHSLKHENSILTEWHLTRG